MVLSTFSNCSLHYFTGKSIGQSLVLYRFIQEFVYEYNMCATKTLPTKDLIPESSQIIWYAAYHMLDSICIYDISYTRLMWSVWSYVKRNKRRERRYSQKLNLDDMKKAIQIQKDIKVKVSKNLDDF